MLDTTARQELGATGAVVLAPAQGARFWSDRPRVRITAPAPAGATSGRLLRGTGEFDGLRGSFTETWDLQEVNADGSTTGRILLSTLAVGTD